MKEGIAFKTESSIKGRKEIAKINEYVNNFNFDCAFERKVEQVPETFADVKQLTKELIEKIKLNKDVWEINIQEHFIDIQKMYVTYRVKFTDIGNILFDSYLKIAENKTAAEMWAIIKSLIGEK